MHASQVTAEVIDRANDLYWGSDRSVNQIADDLELSKGALYGIIEPEASGHGCPLCGDEVVYSNRTAKDKGMLDCPACDWDGAPDETVAAPEATSPASANGASAAHASTVPPTSGYGEDDTHTPERLPPTPYVRPSTTTIAGGALIGAAVGLALVLWARRR